MKNSGRPRSKNNTMTTTMTSDPPVDLWRASRMRLYEHPNRMALYDGWESRDGRWALIPCSNRASTERTGYGLRLLSCCGINMGKFECHADATRASVEMIKIAEEIEAAFVPPSPGVPPKFLGDVAMLTAEMVRIIAACGGDAGMDYDAIVTAAGSEKAT